MNVALHSDRAGRSAPVGLRCLSICAGGGGLDLGFELAFPGARAVAYVEREAFAAAHLVAAMRAGLMAPAPVWSDALTLDGRAWRGVVDCVIGGIPCQPHSLAGKRLGRDDERDLWGAFRRIIVQSGAWLAAVENVPGMATSGGLERVWRDLRRLGFAVEGGFFSAAEIGAPHERARLFVLAVHAGRLGRAMADAGGGAGEQRYQPLPPVPRAGEAEQIGLGCRPVADADGAGFEKRCGAVAIRPQHAAVECGERAMGDAAGERWGEGRPEPGVRRGRDAAPGVGGAMADADGAEFRRIAPAGQFAQLQPDDGFGGWDMGDALGGGCDGRADGPLRSAGGRAVDQGAGGGACGLPLFPPGPGDVAGWLAALAGAPQLEPAIRRVADGLAAGLDATRVDELRMLGNGVCPLAAGHAFRALWSAHAARLGAGADEPFRGVSDGL